jgi:hypothetical protein
MLTGDNSGNAEVDFPMGTRNMGGKGGGEVVLMVLGN